MDDSQEDEDLGIKIDAVFSLASEEAEDITSEPVADETFLQTGSDFKPAQHPGSDSYAAHPTGNEVNSPIIIPQGCEIKPCKVRLVDMLHERSLELYSKRTIRCGGGNIVKIEKDEDKECKNFDVIFAEGASYERGQRKRKANILLQSKEFVEGTKSDFVNIRKLKGPKCSAKFTKYRPLRISLVVLKQNKNALYEHFKKKLRGNLQVEILCELADEALQRPSQEAPVQICRRRQVARTKKKLRLCRREDDPYPSPPRLEPSGLAFPESVVDHPPVLQPAMLDSNSNLESISLSFSGRFRKRNKRLDKEYVLSKKRKVAKVTPMQNNSEENKQEKAHVTNTKPFGYRAPTLKSLLAEHRISKVPKSPRSRTESPRPSVAATVRSESGTTPPEFTAAVNKLARKENTKKFFQLKVGDKIVLIPTDGHSVMPKAFVLDAAKKTAPEQGKSTTTNSESAQSSNFPSSPQSPSNEETFIPIVPKQEPPDESEMTSYDVPSFLEIQEQILKNKLEANVTSLNTEAKKVLTVSSPDRKVEPPSKQTMITSFPVSYRSILPRFPPPTIAVNENNFKTKTVSYNTLPPADLERSHSIVQQAIRQHGQSIKTLCLPPTSKRALAPSNEKRRTIIVKTSPSKVPGLSKKSDAVKNTIKFIKFDSNVPAATKIPISPQSSKISTIPAETSPSSLALSSIFVSTVSSSVTPNTVLSFPTPYTTATSRTASNTVVSSATSNTVVQSATSNTVVPSVTSFQVSDTVVPSATLLPSSDTVVPSATLFPSSNTVPPSATLLTSASTVTSPSITFPLPASSFTSGIPLPDGNFAYFILPSTQQNQQNLLVYTDTSDPVCVPSVIPNLSTTVSAGSPFTIYSANDSIRSLLKKTVTSSVTTRTTVSTPPPTSHTVVTSDSKSVITVYPPPPKKTKIVYPTAEREDERLVASNVLKYLSQVKKSEVDKQETPRVERLIVNMPFKSSPAHRSVGLKSTSESSASLTSESSASLTSESSASLTSESSASLADYQQGPSSKSESLSNDGEFNAGDQIKIKQEPEPEELVSTPENVRAAGEEGDVTLDQEATSAQTEEETIDVVSGEFDDGIVQKDVPETKSEDETASETKSNCTDNATQSSDTESEDETKSSTFLRYENVTLDNGNTATIVSESVSASENEMDEKIRKLKEMLRIQRDKVEKLRQSKLISEIPE